MRGERSENVWEKRKKRLVSKYSIFQYLIFYLLYVIQKYFYLLIFLYSLIIVNLRPHKKWGPVLLHRKRTGPVWIKLVIMELRFKIKVSPAPKMVAEKTVLEGVAINIIFTLFILKNKLCWFQTALIAISVLVFVLAENTKTFTQLRCDRDCFLKFWVGLLYNSVVSNKLIIT